jgi:hypothetical protein
MLPQRTKWARVGCFVSLLLLLAAGGVVFMRYQSTTSCHQQEFPLKTLAVTIDPGRDEQFIEQSRSFAFKYGFRFDIGTFDENSSDWRFHMIRKDIEVIARSLSSPGVFEIGFYNYDCIHPTTASDIEDLVNDFKSFMSDVPAVMITE